MDIWNFNKYLNSEYIKEEHSTETNPYELGFWRSEVLFFYQMAL